MFTVDVKQQYNNAPLKFFLWKSCLLYNFNMYHGEYFHETLYQYKASSKDMQRTRTITPRTFFDWIMLFCKFHNGNSVCTRSPKTLEIFSQNLVQIYIALSGDEQRARTIITPTFLLNYSPWKLCPLNNFETLWDIFIKLGRNIKRYQAMCRERGP